MQAEASLWQEWEGLARWALLPKHTLVWMALVAVMASLSFRHSVPS